METRVWVMLFCGVIISCPPTFLLLETGHLVFNRARIDRPFREGILTGSFFGFIALYSLFKSTSGEGALGVLFLSPFIVMAFGLGGVLVSYIYEYRGNRTLFGEYHAEATCFKRFAKAFMLTCILISMVMAFLNPDGRDFSYFWMLNYNVVGKDVSGHWMGAVAEQNVHRSNYILFSIFESSRPGRKVKALGMFHQFIITEKRYEPGEIHESVTPSRAIMEVPGMPVVPSPSH